MGHCGSTGFSSSKNSSITTDFSAKPLGVSKESHGRGSNQRVYMSEGLTRLVFHGDQRAERSEPMQLELLGKEDGCEEVHETPDAA